MFVKTVEGIYVNLLGADVITREDNKTTSRYVIRHGGNVSYVVAYAADKPGTSRRDVFDIVEDFVNRMTMVPDSVSTSGLMVKSENVDYEKKTVTLEPQEAVNLLKEALECIRHLESERDSSRKLEVKCEEYLDTLRKQLADSERELASSRLANEMNVKTIKELQAEAAGFAVDCNELVAGSPVIGDEHFIDELEENIFDREIIQALVEIHKQHPFDDENMLRHKLAYIALEVSKFRCNGGSLASFVVLWIMVKFGHKAAVEFAKDLQHHEG